MKWLWAAYRRGVFSHLPEFPSGLEPGDFKTVTLAVIGDLLSRNGDAWLFIAHTPKGQIPIGMVIGFPNRGHLEPHVFWFPEASGRNKLECSIRWINDAKEKWKLDLWIRAKCAKFFEHLCYYGLIRTVGKYRECFEDGEDAFLFQSVNWKRTPPAT